MRRVLLCALLLSAATLACRAQRKTLDIYFIDVEGGQATLFVTPEHESLLIDTGWPDHDGRDAKRIAAAAHLAGLQKIDYAVITHYHDDHVGGVPQLLALMPVGTLIDHGPLFERCPTCVAGFDAYMEAIRSGKARRMTVAPGQRLPLHGIEAEVLSADGAVLSSPLPGTGARNVFCEKSEIRPADATENSRSVGLLVSYGKFRTADLGDLTWDKERELMCPSNRVGDVSLLIVSHHGWYQSSSPAYVDAVRPEVAVMDNGATKGGSLPTVITLRQIPGLRDLWQLHRSQEAGSNNTADDRIANLNREGDNDAGNYLKVSASRDGSFTMFNPRTGQTVAYSSR